MVERLKLTDDQRKAMDGILLEHREKLIDLRASLEKAELVMEPMMGADQPDEGQILAQIDKVAQARAELEKANARFLLALRGKLTPEQWKQLQADRDRHQPGPGEWKHGGQGQRGQGPGGLYRQRGPGSQFPRQEPPSAAPPQPPPTPEAAPQSAAPAPGTGAEQ
jgi:Spy/CpxP family protein refolding chaperone